jgi:hypothetical protein
LDGGREEGEEGRKERGKEGERKGIFFPATITLGLGIGLGFRVRVRCRISFTVIPFHSPLPPSTYPIPLLFSLFSLLP